MENREVNDQAFMNMLATVDPGLWRVKKSLMDRGINPDAIPPIVEAISHIYHSTKWGTISITMEDGVIKAVNGKTFRKVDIDAVW